MTLKTLMSVRGPRCTYESRSIGLSLMYNPINKSMTKIMYKIGGSLIITDG